MSNVLTPRKIKGYGWRPDLPDPRDHTYEGTQSEETLTQEHDLWEAGLMPPIYDQSQLGSCTGNGWARVMEKLAMEQGEADFTPSRMFIYQNELIQDGVFGQDVGAQIRDGAKVVANLGVCPETIWPYDLNNFPVRPPQEAYDAALKFEALEYKRVVIGPGAPMRSAISQGFPIVFGFPVPDYFEGNWDPAAEPLPIPGQNANYIGGHCVVVTGYDWTRSKHPNPYFICDNSWGPGWGNQGRFMMDYRWFTPSLGLADDLWIVEKVS